MVVWEQWYAWHQCLIRFEASGSTGILFRTADGKMPNLARVNVAKPTTGLVQQLVRDLTLLIQVPCTLAFLYRRHM